MELELLAARFSAAVEYLELAALDVDPKPGRVENLAPENHLERMTEQSLPDVRKIRNRNGLVGHRQACSLQGHPPPAPLQRRHRSGPRVD
jgi:hypothetical protein